MKKISNYCRAGFWGCALSALVAEPSLLAQQVRLPRASAPQLLLGFETPESAGNWTGMKCALTSANVSEGHSALNIFYPKWDGGKEGQWLAASVAWEGGKGFGVRDWSHYGKLSWDAWVDGQDSLEIALELSGAQGGVSYTKEMTLKPGAKNHIEISLEDAAATIDLAQVQAITLYGIRPKNDTAMTIDNVTLLPGDKLPLAVFDLVYPNYRDLIFPGTTNLQVRAELQTGDYGLNPEDLDLLVTATAKRTVVSSQGQAQADSVKVELPTAKLPSGKATVQAVLRNHKTGQALATNVWTVRKITTNEVATFKTYVDEHNRIIADGKPFFPLGWFGNTSLDQLEEISSGPFNTVLPYGVNGKSKAYVTRYLDLVQGKGMKLIYCMNDIYPTATYYEKTGWEGIFGNSNIADAVVKTYKSHPATLAWYLNDERPKELMPKFVDYYRQACTNDPTHPTFIVIYNLPEVKYFTPTTDMMGVDRYPIVSDPITTVAKEMQIAQAAVKGHKPVLAVIQAFGWYQYNTALPDRGRIPTEEDLKAGRAPTIEETKNMAYQALVHGANGLLFYCYYDLRVLPQYKEYWTGIKSLANEIKVLSPVLLSPAAALPVACEPVAAGVDTLLKEMDGELYLLAVNTSDKAQKVTFKLPQEIPTKISVMFEGRFAMETKANQLTDQFAPLAAHVYDLGPVKK